MNRYEDWDEEDVKIVMGDIRCHIFNLLDEAFFTYEASEDFLEKKYGNFKSFITDMIEQFIDYNEDYM